MYSRRYKPDDSRHKPEGRALPVENVFGQGYFPPLGGLRPLPYAGRGSPFEVTAHR